MSKIIQMSNDAHMEHIRREEEEEIRSFAMLNADSFEHIVEKSGLPTKITACATTNQIPSSTLPLSMQQSGKKKG